MYIYNFTLIDDLLGWDINEKFISNMESENITKLWEMSTGSFKERIQKLIDGVQAMGYTIEPLQITKSFSLE